MGWFVHSHWWIQKTGINRIKELGIETPVGCMIVDECRCGAVRVVEIRPGEAPIIRITESLPLPARERK